MDMDMYMDMDMDMDIDMERVFIMLIKTLFLVRSYFVLISA